MYKSKILSAILTLAYACASAQVLVEAESFEKRGGWVSDHQAFEKIQSAYLMAHGLVHPVEDAVTTTKFNRSGKYHLYVST